MTHAHDSDAVRGYWDEVRARLGQAVLGAAAVQHDPPEAWAFGDGAEMADDLLGLVLAGEKVGTSSAVASYEPGETYPRPGGLSILLDGHGRPRALIRTTAVVRTRFCDVTKEFAASEGEDDRTLASWRRGHEHFFQRELGDGFAEDIEVFCETFEVLAR
ncbi:ASCH domain-containing protein [Propionicicella superfundia]|uniref:ASCH domain-containing protein n=1 Tax=Propionicicella superfundia TaxID=348582 RepID=UPI00041B0CE5|nr:ASCH domain-containing protein [Propionicicella superfundia]